MKKDLFENIKIMAANSNSPSQFLKDPIYNEVNFEGETLWMYKILDTLEFQRLRDIKQLGLSARFFPGATHSRASHCLGVYEIMRQMLLNPSFKSISKNDRLTLLCAALLHDVGHAAHSHAFEGYFYESLENFKMVFNHEYLSVKLVTNERGQIAPLLLKNGVDPLMVAALIDTKQKIKKIPLWMAQLVSSELDVDRIDYLLRDSYYTGTSYGQIDARALIHWTFFDQKAQRISFFRKAIPTVENFLVSRYHMYETVYKNDKSTILNIVLWFAFKRIAVLDKANQFDWGAFDYIRDTIRILFTKKNCFSFDLNKYLLLNDNSFDTFLFWVWKNCEDKILIKILESYYLENKFIIIFFKSKDNQLKALKELEKTIKDPLYNLAAYDWKTKDFYNPSSISAEITIYDEINKKSIGIDKESQLIKNRSRIFDDNKKFKYGIVVNHELIPKNLKINNLLKTI